MKYFFRYKASTKLQFGLKSELKIKNLRMRNPFNTSRAKVSVREFLIFTKFQLVKILLTQEHLFSTHLPS